MDSSRSEGADAQAFALRKLYKHLRVVDVTDALDGIGYFNLTLMDRAIRPLWPGMRFWGAALTIRCVPARRPMWKLDTTEDIVDAHGVWFREVGNVGFGSLIRPGHVLVTDTGGAGEVGFWGSNNSLGAMAAGAVGIVTDGYCRDTGEVALQRTPICARAIGRTIIPGRIEVVEAQAVVGCGGVQVRPGDIVGCDDDGVVVVPLEVAAEVAVHARAVLLADMRGRRGLYERLGLPLDDTVDVAAVEAYYDQIDQEAGS
jgi:4-hydroxy-4-methyl-2-oxoglutarate aldolase